MMGGMGLCNDDVDDTNITIVMMLKIGFGACQGLRVSQGLSGSIGGRNRARPFGLAPRYLEMGISR